VTFDEGDPNINNLPFPRQVQKKFSKPSLKFHGNSRSEYLEGFKRHQQVVKDAEKQHQATNIQEHLNETDWSTSNQPVQVNDQPSEIFWNKIKSILLMFMVHSLGIRLILELPLARMEHLWVLIIPYEIGCLVPDNVYQKHFNNP
jgi:hypothetical protein